jgi:Uma2 family endonuclease
MRLALYAVNDCPNHLSRDWFMTTVPSLSADSPAQFTLPDHTQLPESDGMFVKNFQEHPQSILLTLSITPVLEQLHPDGQYCIGQDSGIYWRLTEPPQRGAEAPDWFYVPNVPPTLDGKLRRSYVLWQEIVSPLIVLEFVSGDGKAERDRTPYTGKFWIYEQAIRVPFYGIYEVEKSSVELYHLIDGHYSLMPENERGHYAISLLGVELGIWQGTYQNATLPWLRWWDAAGHLLLTGEEKVEQERQRAEQAESLIKMTESLLDQERSRTERLAKRLQSMGIDPDQIE